MAVVPAEAARSGPLGRDAGALGGGGGRRVARLSAAGPASEPPRCVRSKMRWTKLWQSYLDQARARRWSRASWAACRESRGPGQRRRDPAEPGSAQRGDRQPGLVDLRVAKAWEGCPPGSYGLAFDAKLERYTVGDAKGNLHVRAVDDNREIVELPGPGIPAWVVRFSPSGRYLAAKYAPPDPNEANRVWVWDLTRGQTVLKTADAIWNVAMAFSPDDRFLAVGWMKGGIALHDLSSGADVRQLPSEAPAVYITFHPDGTQYAYRTLDGRVFVCGAADGRTLHVLSGEEGPVWNAAGTLLAVGCADMRIRVYDTNSWQERAVLEDSAHAFAFSHSGNLLATAGGEPTLRLWHPLDSSPLLTVQGASVGAVPAFAPGDRLLAHQIDGSKILLFEVLAAPECRKLIVEPASNSRIWHTDVSPDGRLLAGACDDGVHLWDLGKGDQVALLPARWAHRAVHAGRHRTDRERLLWAVAMATPMERTARHQGPPDRTCRTHCTTGRNSGGRLLSGPRWSDLGGRIK